MRIDTYVSDRRKLLQKRRILLYAVAGIFSAYFLLYGIFAFIVRSPAFQVSRVMIQGSGHVSEKEIITLVNGSILNHNASVHETRSAGKALLGLKNMLIWPDALPPETVALIPQLQAVSFSKNYFLHTITITAMGRQPFAVWCSMPGDNCYWFDSEGIVFEKTMDTQGNAILVVHDYSGSKVIFNQKVMSENFIGNLLSIVNALKDVNLNIQEVALHDLSLEQIDVTLINGPVLHFSLRFPANNDLIVLKSLMTKPGFNMLEYIDFTTKNRAYFK